jgi:hypothetical protein
MSETPPDSLVPQSIRCPRCAKQTDRIQVCQSPFVLCLIIYVAWSSEKIIGCPECVRSRLGTLALMSIPAANVLCPVMLAWYAIQYAVSHYTDRPGFPEECLYLADAEPSVAILSPDKADPRTRPLRLILVLMVLVAVIAVAFLVLPKLASH